MLNFLNHLNDAAWNAHDLDIQPYDGLFSLDRPSSLSPPKPNQDGDLTDAGDQAAEFPLDPQLAPWTDRPPGWRMLLAVCRWLRG